MLTCRDNANAGNALADGPWQQAAAAGAAAVSVAARGDGGGDAANSDDASQSEVRTERNR